MVAGSDRSSTAAVPSAIGCATGRSGSIHCKPKSSSRTSAKKGDAIARGWMAEQMSCTNPGKLQFADRKPPPIWSFASSRRTCRPSRASVIAAARPLGPEPTMTASYAMLSPGKMAACRRETSQKGEVRGRRENGFQRRRWAVWHLTMMFIRALIGVDNPIAGATFSIHFQVWLCRTHCIGSPRAAAIKSCDSSPTVSRTSGATIFLQ